MRDEAVVEQRVVQPVLREGVVVHGVWSEWEKGGQAAAVVDLLSLGAALDLVLTLPGLRCGGIRARLAALAALSPLVAPPEQFVLGTHAAYLHCANGILDTEPYRKLGRNQLRVATWKMCVA